MCMKAANPVWDSHLYAYGRALAQCGLQHPEYLTYLANSIPPPDTGYVSDADLTRYYGGASPYYVGKTWQYGTLCIYTITGILDEERFIIRCDWLITWWQRLAPGMYEWCWYCRGFLSEEEVLAATLSQPIVMDEIRAVTPTFAFVPGAGLHSIYMEYEAKPGETPIAFRNGALIPWGGRHYYPMIYSAKFDIEHTYPGGYGYKHAYFTVKNLARVTKEGVL